MSAKTTVKRLLDELSFVPEAVVMAASRQPGLFVRAAEFRVKCFRARARAYGLLARCKARLALQLREQAQTGGDRVTERHLEALITRNAKICRLEKLLALAEEDEEYAKLLVEAFRMRRDCIRVIAELTGTERAMARFVREGQEELTEVQNRLAAKYGSR